MISALPVSGAWQTKTTGAQLERPRISLLHEPFAELGSAQPELDASLAAHATVGKISDCLWQRVTPSPAEIAHIAEFCLRAITPAATRGGRSAPDTP